MIKKISILTLLLLFFVSTTGLPLTIHFCNMMHKEANNTCKMHNAKKMMSEMHSDCCKKNDAKKAETIKKASCCKLETVLAGVKDSFISYKTESENNSVTKLFFVTEITPEPKSLNISIYSFIDTSPPLLQGNHLYLTNSILLI